MQTALTGRPADPEPGRTRRPRGHRRPPPGRRRPWAAPLRSSLTPVLLLAVLTAAVLRHYEVPFSETGAFCAYLVLGITLPGTLLWRALHGGPRCTPEDLAAGTALGYSLEVLAYIPARWAGVPLLFLLWPAATLIGFAAVPRLRRHWRRPATVRTATVRTATTEPAAAGTAAARVPVAWSWAMSTAFAVVVVWSGRAHFRFHGLRWPGNARPDLDLTYHLALAGELRHHVPPTVPWVLGEPLRYHWFVYADLAATGWATGIETQTLLYRLSMLPMIGAFAVLLAAAARRLSGRWWTGPATVAAGLLMVAPGPGTGLVSLDTDLAQLRPSMWLSPTQTFGALLFSAVVVLVVALLDGTARGPAPWVALCPLLAALMGAKATYLPLLLAGLLLVAVVGPRRAGRRVRRTALALAGVTAASGLLAKVLLFGGTSQGLAFEPGAALRSLAMTVLAPGLAVHAQRPPAVITPGAIATAVAGIGLGWICVWSGIAGFAGRPGIRSGTGPRPAAAVVFLLGIGIAGLVGLLALVQPGGSQIWFSRAGDPYLTLAAVCGLAAALPARLARPARLPLCCQAAAGAGLALVWSRLGGAPAARSFLALLAVAAATTWAITMVAAARRRRGLGPAGAIVLLSALAIPASARWQLLTWRIPPYGVPVARPQVLSAGGVAAARWLRGHSAPGDVVATNAHCLVPSPTVCANLHFWVSAYAERRVLVEGWGYTARINALAARNPGLYSYLPFWDPHRLADNDAAFRDPSPAAVGALRDRYGVRWLFADDRFPGLSPHLGEVAAPRFRSGHCAVYEVTR